MIIQELRQLHEVLNRKADVIQHEFIAVNEKLQELNRRLTEGYGADRAPLLAEREALYEKQQTLADEINQWRDRARDALRQDDDQELRSFLDELLVTSDETIRTTIEQVQYYLNASDEDLEKLAQSKIQARPTTAVGRLVERVRTEFDLRGTDQTPRRKIAFEFANRPGMPQNDDALNELEAVLEDKDPLVNEVLTLTLIQMHRFRALRLGDLAAAYTSVQRLTTLKHRAVIPVLIEVLENPRMGFVDSEEGMTEESNSRLRVAALQSLAVWHTPEAQTAVWSRQMDNEPVIAREAIRVIELYPGDW